MKKITTALALAALLIATVKTGISATEVRVSESKSTAEERQVKNFSGIASSGKAIIKIVMGSEESLRVEGSPEAVKEIETVVEDWKE